MAEADLESGRVAILGAGREGRAAWRYLRSRYPALDLTLIDEQPLDAALAGSLTERDRVLTGRLSQVGLENFDVLVRSPGISVYRPSLQRALAAGVKVTTPSNLWFAAHRDQRTVCITGTKGKSTTSTDKLSEDPSPQLTTMLALLQPAAKPDTSFHTPAGACTVSQNRRLSPTAKLIGNAAGSSKSGRFS